MKLNKNSRPLKPGKVRGLKSERQQGGGNREIECRKSFLPSGRRGPLLLSTITYC